MTAIERLNYQRNWRKNHPGYGQAKMRVYRHGGIPDRAHKPMGVIVGIPWRLLERKFLHG